MNDLSGKVFLVAGGGSGIGAETARILARRGASVVVGDIHAGNAAAVAQEIATAGGQASACAFDIRDEGSVASLIAVAGENYGGLDGVHVNAADMGAFLHDTDAVDVPLEIFDQTIAVNLRGLRWSRFSGQADKLSRT